MDSTSDKIAMIVQSTAVPGKRDELFALYEQHLVPRAEANEEQQVVVWVADQHDDDRFFLFELYADAESMGANAQADWFFAYLQAAGPMLAGEPQVTMGNPRWSKGL